MQNFQPAAPGDLMKWDPLAKFIGPSTPEACKKEESQEAKISGTEAVIWQQQLAHTDVCQSEKEG